MAPKKTQQLEAPDEFPVSVDEFLANLPKHYIGARAGFKHHMKNNSGKRTPAEWKQLFDKYLSSASE